MPERTQTKTSLHRNAMARDVFGCFPKYLNDKYNEIVQLKSDMEEDKFPQDRKKIFKGHYLF